ncbi:hypothetical protein ACQP1W_42135 [Spirillospora sp. CA-255316]
MSRSVWRAELPVVAVLRHSVSIGAGTALLAAVLTAVPKGGAAAA